MNKAKRAAALIGITMAFALPAGAAAAAESCTYPATCEPTGQPQTEVKAGSQSTTRAEPAAASATLPVTGGDVVGMTVLGAGALAVGTILVRRSRKA
ncbi:MAG: LPXTG cell wall anchor domain-containing protein [Acidimicrobiia bacterium]